MIRTVVKPSKPAISINVPEDFIGKEVEVIAFTIEEAKNVHEKTVTHFAAEASLAKDWLTAEEDEAWRNL